MNLEKILLYVLIGLTSVLALGCGGCFLVVGNLPRNKAVASAPKQSRQLIMNEYLAGVNAKLGTQYFGPAQVSGQSLTVELLPPFFEINQVDQIASLKKLAEHWKKAGGDSVTFKNWKGEVYAKL
jgi:hypothetical protein